MIRGTKRRWRGCSSRFRVKTNARLYIDTIVGSDTITVLFFALELRETIFRGKTMANTVLGVFTLF